MLLIVAVPLVAGYAPSHDEDGAALRRLAKDPQTPLPRLLAHAEAASARHPFDSYPAALVAARLRQSGQPEAARTWLNRALLRNPRDPFALRETAALHFPSGDPRTALLFLRLALSHGDDEDQRRSLALLAQEASHAEDVLSALPTLSLLPRFLDVAGEAEAPRWSLLAEVAQAGLAADNPPPDRRERAAYWLGRAALAQRSPPAAAQALTQLQALPSRPDAPPPTLLVADLLDLLSDAGQAEQAARLGQAWLGRARSGEWLLSTARASLRLSPPPFATIRALLDEALASNQALPSSQRALLARAHELYADLEAAQENSAAARSHQQAAARLRQP